ncbi:ABC transporter ATP-binding protein [Actinomadura rifamycini]|uniref:ABC transporter ATP-binding protein n=1 Tax=Actinomadura rifamycini TaxID=31962 RepID=UPI0004288B1B|nr:ABC transporter ATP-binding protein [Actinomadura rifamycini]
MTAPAPNPAPDPTTDPRAHANLLELSGVHASYGRISVLHGVDLAVGVGRIVALLGPNGAGKTTTLNVAAGLHLADRGDVRVGGRAVAGADPVELARRGVCLIPEGRGIFPNLTVRENLRMMTFTGADRAAVEETAYTRFPKLAERRRQTAGTMSGGEQQMLALARGLATDPAVLLIDELSMGLAPLVVAELYELVVEIARTGVAVLVVEQFASTVMRICDLAAVMVNGRIERVDAPGDELLADLSALYLGSAT